MIVKVLIFVLALLGLITALYPFQHAPALLQHAPTPLLHAPAPLQHAGLHDTPRGYTQQVVLKPNTQPRHVHIAYGGRYRVFRLVVRCSFLFKNNNCYWLK